ncbi:MAG: hypothetical protein ACFFED_05825 [Candidatus Thorarchaeota archaeon]
MHSKDTGDDMLQVWCPLIPASKISTLSHHIVELERVNDRYDDWRASMRTKKVVNTHIGVLLDRIRILLMGIGIACASNRQLADTIQGVISECLRKSCLSSLDKIKEGKQQEVVKTTERFLGALRFTRDIYPEEEIAKAYRSVGLSGNEASVVSGTLELAGTIVMAVYLRLLSPDPWQSMDEC